MPAVERRTATRIAGLITAVVVVSMVIVAVVALVGDGKTDNVRAFNACISRSRSLVLTKQASGGRTIETIRDRAHMNIVGKFAVFPSVSAAQTFAGTLPSSGSGVIKGRMVLLTTAADGHDTNVIQTCGEPEFPGP
jgi:3-deoxy-D-arabino-heptulosonate 7-phosphate (DAHP) synthase class II